MSNKTPDNGPMHLLIDTDADFDDYMAITFCLSHPDIIVEGITVTGCGAAHLTAGAENINNFLTVFDDESIIQIPVCKGFQRPLMYSNTFPYSVRSAANDLYGQSVNTNPNPVLEDAEDFLISLLENSQHSYTVLMIGGGTTWGTLIKRAETEPYLNDLLLSKVERIVMFGGNLTSEYAASNPATGNIQPTLGNEPYYTNEVAEWNIFIDPLGSKYVIDSAIPVTMVTLNASQHIPIDQLFVDTLSRIDLPQAQFLTDILRSPANEDGIGVYLDFWDPLAACALVNERLVPVTEFNIDVNTVLNEEDDKSGQLCVSPDASVVSLALQADPNEVKAFYLEIIAGGVNDSIS